MFSDAKIPTIDPVFSKQNVFNKRLRKITLNIAECQQPGILIMMFSVIASNGKITPVWIKRDYKLTYGVYKKILEIKILSWNKKINVNTNYNFQQNERRNIRRRLCRTD